MTKKPYMPFFPDAYLSDTVCLTMEEQGAYFRLLCYMWINGGKLENNDKKITRILNIHPNKWQKIRASVIAYFTPSSPGYLTQNRLQKEYERARKSIHNTSGNTPGIESDNALENQESDSEMKRVQVELAQTLDYVKSRKASTGHPNPSPIPNINDKDKIEAVETCGKLPKSLLSPEDRIAAFADELIGYFDFHNLTPPTDFTIVEEWIRKGADPLLDILPVVRGVLEEISRKQYRSPQSWKYFGKEVFTSLRKRRY